jgi:hypothetical protein
MTHVFGGAAEAVAVAAEPAVKFAVRGLCPG